MINYYSYVLTFDDDFLKICADYNIQFETHEETYCMEPPPKLVEIISNGFDSRNFDFYKIYFKPIEIKKVTCVTDYRGIRGLLSLPAGILCGSCVSTTHKVYFGVDTAHDAMLSSKDSFIICCPKFNCITSETIFSLIKELPAESFNSFDVLSKDIYLRNSNLYVINWNVRNMIELSVRGNINKVFSSENLSALKNIVKK